MAGQPTPEFLPGESQGQRKLAGYSPCGDKELDMTEATWHACRHASLLDPAVKENKAAIAVDP